MSTNSLNIIPLGYIADIIGGVCFEKNDVSNKGIRILRGGNIRDNHLSIEEDDVFLPDLYADDKNQIRIGDTIIVASTGSVEALGKTATVFADYPNTQIGAFLRIIRPKDAKYAMIISAFLNSNYFKRYITSQAKGTSINNINMGHLQNFMLYLPNEIQLERVSKLYLDIQKKIALNRAINHNLEAMAKQLYDYWFVQFDFPNADGKPYKSSGGKMVWNERLKRAIPYDWQVSDLGELGNFRNGVNYSLTEEYDKKCRIVNVRNITSSTYFINTSELDVLKLSESLIGRYIIKENDILIARSGCPGSTRLVCINKGEMDVIFCGFIINFSVYDAMTKPYLFFLLKGYEAMIKAQSNGSIMPNISQDSLKPLCVAVPPKTVLTEFNAQLNPVMEQCLIKMNENNELTKLRDELLPLLMNGQVSVNYDLT